MGPAEKLGILKRWKLEIEQSDEPVYKKAMKEMFVWLKSTMPKKVGKRRKK